VRGITDDLLARHLAGESSDCDKQKVEGEVEC
jgi:hypothetical protein